MYCQNCGKEIEDDSNVCKYCGARVAGDDPGDPSKATLRTPPAKTQGGSNGTASLVCGLIALACCFIGIFIAGIPLAVTALILSLIGLPLGVKALKATRNPAGMIISIISLVFAIVELIVVIAMLALIAAL